MAEVCEDQIQRNIMQMKHITQMETISTDDLISVCYGEKYTKNSKD